jgi:hypothetical protein
METHYLNQFQQGVKGLNEQLFSAQGLELKVGVWLNSVALKIQNQAWLNSAIDHKPFEESIFFSIWINHQSIRESKICYNIHALKLRELSDHKIKSRDFAQAFRRRFKPFEKDWPNVSTTFGPLTLMEGWVPLHVNTLRTEIIKLATNFLAIAPIIDNLLAETKK